jgi:DNA-binding transcriptional LysR family regulator
VSIRYLKTLIAIADHGSFGAAADAMYLTQSAVSMQMKALEDELRTELFDRSKRPPVLNAYGKALLQRARDVVFRYEQMIEAVSEANDLTGTLSVGAIPTALSGIVPQALAALRTSHPRLQVRVVEALSAPLLERVRQGDVDAAIIGQPTDLPDTIAWKPFASEPLIVIAPAGADDASDEKLLTSLPYIRFNRRAWVGRLIEASLNERGIAVQEMMELDSLETISLMVYHGLGVSIVPQRCAEHPLPLPLTRVPFGAPPLRRVIGLAERANNRKAKLTAALYSELARLGRFTDMKEPRPG